MLLQYGLVCWCAFSLSILNSVAGQSTCRTSGFPPEWKILLDSYGYDSLLNLWSRNPDPGSYSHAGGVCTRRWSLCEGTEESWLFTQGLSFGNAQEVFFNISYDFGDCRFIPECNKQYVTVYKYSQPSKATPADIKNPGNYVLITGSAESSRLEQSARKSPGDYNILAANRPPSDNYFSCGFKDEGTCGSIKRVIIYYIVCPSNVNGLVHYREVSLPPRSSPNSVYSASCAPNAHNVTSLDVVIISDKSTCKDRAPGGARCECDAGYHQNGIACEACSAGTYRPFESPATSDCVVCPANTQIDVVAATRCPCITGYFRALDEGPALGCTRPPNQCTNLRVISSGDKSVVIQWSRPSITGRSDFFYMVSVSDPSRPGEYILVNRRLVNTNSIVTYNVMSLEAFQTYRVRVTTHNDVSHQDAANDHLRVCEVTATTRQGVPSVVSRVEGFCSVIVWELPAQTNGEVQQYELLFTQGKRKNTTTNFYVTSEEERKSANSVQVRARNRAGYGQYSVSSSVGCSDDVPTSCPVQNTPSPLSCPPSTGSSNSLHFRLKGRNYLNNAVVVMEDIGEGDDALLCVSDHTSCCSSGEFFYPNGSMVSVRSSNYDFYRNRGRGLGYIRLNRRNSVAACPQGRYQCVIQDSSGQNQNIYIYIVVGTLECPALTLSTPEPAVGTCPEAPTCSACPSPETLAPCNCPTLPPATPLSCPTCPPPTACPTSPTTSKPTTLRPTTLRPTTLRPTTLRPTTLRPTTLRPTTLRPTTLEPTTSPPTETETTTQAPNAVTSSIATSLPVEGFYFRLQGRQYGNNSKVAIEDIGEGNNALFCVSEHNPRCCNGAGEFYYPNCSRVLLNRDGHTFWRNRGKGQSFIRLNLRPNRAVGVSGEGVYKCDIPYPNDVKHKLYISLVLRENLGKKYEISNCFK